MMMNALSFCLPGNIFLSLSFLKNNIVQEYSWLPMFFFCYFEYILPLSSGLQDFWWEIY